MSGYRRSGILFGAMMACTEDPAGQTASPRWCGANETAGPRGPRGRIHWMLLLLLVALQITDVVTTNSGLAIPGNWEVNPIMAWCQAEWGSAWWLPKIVVVGFAAV